MASVSLQHIKKTYHGEKGADVTVVHDFNLEIRDREFVVFVGPSGCGKSTTLRMIAGLEEITCGNILIGDRRVNDVAPKDRDIAMVFQNYALYPHMSVFDNMAFALKLRQLPKQEIRRRVEEAAKILGITEYLQRKPKALSGGQRQRVAVGRAIVRQPSVFLFDEPLSNLDAKMRVQMRAEIIALHRRLDATMIYVTHDQAEAMTMGERIVVMRDGLIQQAAEPLEIYNKPANLFVAGFLGSPPMNFLEGKLERHGGEFVFQQGCDGLRVNLPQTPGAEKLLGRPTVLGIRPEHCVPGGSGLNTFESQVQLVEPMGAETFFHVSCGRAKIVCRGNDPRVAETGGLLRFSISGGCAHLFDSESGARAN